MIVIFMVLFYRATIAERKMAEEDEAKRKAAASKKASSVPKKD
jgi:hypothetical protein